MIDADGKYLGKYRKHHIPALPSRILGEVLFHAGRSWLSGIRNQVRERRRLHLLRPPFSRGRAHSRIERRGDRVQSIGDCGGIIRIFVGTGTARARRRQRILCGSDQSCRHRKAVEHRRILREELFLQSARQDHRPGQPRQRRSCCRRSRSRHDRRSSKSLAVLPRPPAGQLRPDHQPERNSSAAAD